jgi:DNA-binding phage protein
MTPEQQAAVERARAHFSTPGYRAEASKVRELVEQEFPPIATAPEIVEAMARFRIERERQGLSLADVSERSGIERTALSRLERGQGNPTIGTIHRVATALGMRVELSLVVGG